MIRLIVLTLVLLTPCVSASDPIDTALTDLDRAISTHKQNPDPQPILEAAAVLEHTLESQGIETAGASLALGNAYFIAGDLGHAILQYKRGIQIDPRSRELRDNLAHARSFVQPAPARESTLSFSNLALSWRGIIDRRALFIIALGSLLASAIITTLTILNVRTPRPRLLAFGSFTLAIVAIAPLGYEAWITTASPRVVIVNADTQAMSGPDSSAYDPVFDQGLGAGVEARVIDSRDGWLHLELGSGDRCWIVSDRAAFVSPSARS